jgi:hypothetical protein
MAARSNWLHHASVTGWLRAPARLAAERAPDTYSF